MKILPSILAADFSKLATELAMIEAAGVDMHHIDVMDGNLVPNISFGPIVIKDIAKCATKPLDIHLMIQHPATYIADYVAFNPALISIHFEAADELEPILATIRRANIKAGLAINPSTPFAAVHHLLDQIDVLLIMTVEPGFGGQSFMPKVVDKIAEAKAYFVSKGYPITIEVDGGINEENIQCCTTAGAEWIVAGSSLYNTKHSYDVNVKKLREACV